LGGLVGLLLGLSIYGLAEMAFDFAETAAAVISKLTKNMNKVAKEREKAKSQKINLVKKKGK